MFFRVGVWGRPSLVEISGLLERQRLFGREELAFQAGVSFGDDRWQLFGFEGHGPAAVRVFGLVGDVKVAALKAVGALLAHGLVGVCKVVRRPSKRT